MIINPYRYATGGGGSGPPYRYYRIYITDNNGDATYTGIGECIMATSAGGAQAATGGTASASTQYTSSTGSARQAFDGNTTGVSNGWVTAGGSALPSWLKYDFGAGNAKTLVEIRLYNQTDQYTRPPKDFVVQASNDDTTWTDINSFTGITGWVNSTPKTLTL